MVQPDFSMTQDVLTTPPWPAGTPVPGPPIGPAGGMLAGMYPNPTVVPGVVVPGGTAGGDLNGTYPNPLVDGINGAPVGVTTPLARGDLLVANATPAITRLPLGAPTMQLQSNGTDAVWGYPLAGPPSGPAGGTLTGTYPNPGVNYAAITGTPTSLPPSGAAGGDLQGSYPSPSLTAVAKSKWTESAGTLTPVTTTDLVVIPGAASGDVLRAGTRTIKQRLVANPAADTAFLTINASLSGSPWLQDDATKASWFLGVNAAGDNATIQRIPPGGTSSVVELALDNAGNMTISGALQQGTRTIKTRTFNQTTADASFLTTNSVYNTGETAWIQDDATKASWQVKLNPVVDNFSIWRLAPGGASSVPLLMDNAGNLVIQGQISTGSASSAPPAAYQTSVRVMGTTQGVRFQGTGTAQTDGYSSAIAFGYTSPNMTARVDSTNLGTVNVTPPSDERLKRDIRDDDVPGLETILALRPVTFEYRQEMRETGFPAGRRCGLIAQEAEEHVPFCVEDDGSDEGYLGLDYRALVPVLIRAVQELTAEVRGGAHASDQ